MLSITLGCQATHLLRRNTMDRQALVLYLENVRDLEVVKSRINELWDRERYFYNEEYNNHPTSVGKSV